MRSPPVARALVVAGLALALAAGLTPAAVAAATASIADSPRLLPDGAALGSGAGSATTETMNQPGAGPCGPPRRAGSRSASVFSVGSQGRRLLSLGLTDDAHGSLCYVGVYRASGNGLVFTNPQDIEQRATLQRGSSSGCASASSCKLEVWLDPGAAYYVVAWAQPGGHASFDYTASVRLQPAAAAFVTGHRVADRGRHEVISGRPFTLSARVPVSAGVRFQYEIWTGSGWRQGFDEERTLSNGAASIGLTADPSGRRRFRVVYAGDETTLAWTSAYVEILFVSPRWTRYSDGGVRLPVPWVHQQHRLSCEAASVRMALLSYGISQSDMQILGRIGIDSRPRSGDRWGDPERAFVGNVNGTMPETGYGVHAPPVEKAVNSYRPYRPAIRFKQVSFATIARHLDNGFPVVVWGAHPGRSGLYPVSWTSWDGRRVNAVLVEHTWTLVGFRGPVGSPTHFIVHDPSGAGGVTMTVADVRNFTRHFGNTGVVVR